MTWEELLEPKRKLFDCHTDDMLILVLDNVGIERLAHADPSEVKLKECGKTLVNPRILICHEPESAEFTRVCQSQDLAKIIKFLQRGFEFRPEKGDHDGPPTPIARLN